MSKRTLEELKQAVSNAISLGEAAALKQCATELEEIGTAEARALCELALGLANRLTGNFREALEHYHRAYALHKDLGDRLGIARVTGSIGLVYEQTGNYPKALEHYHRALALHEEQGDRLGIARVTSNIGVLYSEAGNYPKALEHYHRALALYEELGDRLGVAGITGNIGSVYHYMDNYPQALENHHRALAVYEELGDSRCVALVTGNIILALINTATHAEAEALLASMDTIQIDDPGTLTIRETARASIQEHHGKVDDAMHTLSSALETARQHSLMRDQAGIHKQMRDLCQKRNDFAGYIEHNNEFTRIHEEINGRETTIKLTLQEKQREIDAREKEHQKFMAVLHSTLPKHIANRVAMGEQVTD
ncbi:MAG: tetratricopeptide repeat protein, partial [Ignavibacteria bacterium]|nr:tetratricopeptide repeat protein [Ignavibacteria bacterium]